MEFLQHRRNHTDPASPARRALARPGSPGSQRIGCGHRTGPRRPLQNDSVRVDGWVVLGARGWTAPDDPIASPDDERIFRRELERLRLSIADADRRYGRACSRIAMLHFPPLIRDREPTEVVAMLREAQVRVCVYGHLHGEDHDLAVTGERDGILFHFVASDAVGFRPALILAQTSSSR